MNEDERDAYAKRLGETEDRLAHAADEFAVVYRAWLLFGGRGDDTVEVDEALMQARNELRLAVRAYDVAHGETV